MSHPQARGQQCQRGPRGDDVTQWEGGGGSGRVKFRNDITMTGHNQGFFWFFWFFYTHLLSKHFHSKTIRDVINQRRLARSQGS